MRNNQSTSTVIVGHRALLREGLVALLQYTPYKVIASASRASELKNVHVPEGRRTLVIMGIDDGNGSGTEIAESISLLRSLFSESRVVLVAETRGPTDMQQILSLSPNGYIANLGSRDVLIKVLELALLDQRVIVLSRSTPTPKLDDHTESDKQVSLVPSSAPGDLQNSSTVAIAANDPLLSQRERQILFRLAEGDSNKAIARLCNITESTVKVHLKAILRKIAAHNRTQAAIWAVTKGYHALGGSLGHPVKQTDGLGGRSEVKTPGSTSGVGPPLELINIRK